MALETDRAKLIKLYLEEIKNRGDFIENNVKKLDIYEGNLLPYVLTVMEKTLSKNYFDKIKERVVPINVLTRIIDKLSKVYINVPTRQASDKNKEDTDLMSQLAEEMGLNICMSLADEYSHLFKGYALEPFCDEGKACMRVLPYDRFLVLGRDPKNPMKVTDFIKYMGVVDTNDGKKTELYYAYTKDQFIPFTADEHEYVPALEGNDGENPIGRIPFVYGNRSRQSIVPTCDSDIIQMTKMIPIMLSDLAGAIMFQCFTIIYGIDVDSSNISMSPNAFWNLKSDAKSDRAPVIGTIKPEADIDKVLNFIKQVLAFWLETKGVRIGSLNSMDAGNSASGIAKIIDEMDVFEVKKRQIVYFTAEEKDLWDLMKHMTEYWTKTEEEYDSGMFTDKFQASIKFDEPRPEVSRTVKIDEVDKEVKGRYMDRATAIRELNPDMSEEELAERFVAVGLNEDGTDPKPVGEGTDEFGNPLPPEVDENGDPIDPEADPAADPENEKDPKSKSGKFPPKKKASKKVSKKPVGKGE